MDLERISVVIRPRTPWEAVDLGFRMARTWWKSLLGSWLAVAAPLWLLTLVLLHGRPLLAFGVLWGLRPLLDRVPLFVLSRAVFGDTPTVRETVRALPGLLRRRLVGALAERFDVSRSFHLPVRQLEGTGREHRQRIRVLDLEGRSVAVRLTFACFVMEACLLLGALALVALMIPGVAFDEVFELAGAGITEGSSAGLVLVAAAAFAAHALIEPCYVAAGFSLYLRARTRIEGWDVELGLRRLAARLSKHGSVAALALVVLLPLALLAPLPVVGQEREEAEEAIEAESSETPDEAIRRVLAEPEFSSRREVTRWEPREWLRDLDDEGASASRSFRLPSFAGVGRAIATLVAVALVIWVLWQVWSLLRTFQRRRSAASGSGEVPLPEPSVGRTPVTVALPCDVGAAAWELWSRGQGVEALALLYRGALDRLTRTGGMKVDESWTEGEVLRAVDRVLAGEGGSYLRDLTGAWTAAAYAHRLPGDEEVRALCDGWGRHLRGAAA
jgi:hypothetical protein